MNTADFLLELSPEESIALAEAGREYTFEELRASVSMLSGRISVLGLTPGTPIGIMAPNGLFWVSAYIAALRLGLVVVPLAVTLPPEEVVARVRWVGADALLVGRSQAQALRLSLPRSFPMVVERKERLIPRQRSASVDLSEAVDVDPDQDALYMFTSGTTGEPRAVRITHRNIQANTTSILGYLDITPEDRMLMVLPFGYAFGLSILHTHLRAGAAMIIQPTSVPPQAVVDRMEAARCTGFAGVPSTFAMLLRESTFGTAAVSSLRTVQEAGGRLAPVLIDQIVRAQPQASLFVMYGTTEATARLSYLPPEEVGRRPESIGKGIPGVDLRVLDSDGVHVEPGAVGEIWASGANISPGYLDDPEATTRKMPGGMLRTGDLAKVDEDGYIYVVDRIEDFIKSREHRIASLDIEGVVLQLPDIVAAAAVGVPDELAGERVEVVAVRRRGSVLRGADVIAHCRERLAKHMVPEVVRFMDALPMNAAGKVLKREVRTMCMRMADEPGGGQERADDADADDDCVGVSG
ncbi:acyl-CoA synthetase (AMP-forming)/AMP-acid ligase II [Nocardioides luteus]|uniref:Long-chain acyl-CoA synthetase n=1 Tax=Nocardioides luteus TaxID=1844 RepID=A0ABQ5SVW7_9ACTN|nr:AMP-binding protein [Nocardioides luteus]MDR7309229.1 acyl-CoA synthetase (AMP-forming)/AMP-acid ligase II [Nocardioides luteus]GGR48930.1 long-chain acyl-CoA synthetase [Nocardioides luteus]GLJ67634.1 long-chain acyl-CoA synthetase [Nocardioides luteus]